MIQENQIKNKRNIILITILFFISMMFHKHLMFVEGITTSEIFLIIFFLLSIYYSLSYNNFVFSRLSAVILLILIYHNLLFFFNHTNFNFNDVQFFKSLLKLFFYTIGFLLIMNLILRIDKIMFAEIIYKLIYYYCLISIVILAFQYLKLYFKIPIPLDYIWFGLGEEPGKFGTINSSWSIGGLPIYRNRALQLEPSFFGIMINVLFFTVLKIRKKNYFKDSKFYIIIFALFNTFSLTVYSFTLFNFILLVITLKKRSEIKVKPLYISVLILLIVATLPLTSNVVLTRINSILDNRDRSVLKRFNFGVDAVHYNLKKSNLKGVSLGNNNLYTNLSQGTAANKKYFIYRSSKQEYLVEYNINFGVIFLYILSTSGILGFLLFILKFYYLRNFSAKILLFLICMASGSYLDSMFWTSLAAIYFVENV